MKRILFTMRPQEGSCGGGMFFLKNMVKYLTEKGYEVVYDFSKKIDIIFVMDPRRNRTNHIPIEMIERYKKEFPDVHVIHRVNECDVKRERSINLEPLLLRTMSVADTVIFISKWLRDYFVNKYSLTLKDVRVVYNGCNRDYYYPKRERGSVKKPVKIVTHHWSNNFFKGFHVYNALDSILDRLDGIEFTFIGRYNERYRPRNLKLIGPTHEAKLGELLREHDIYLTATRNEPCGMHHIEGLSCGLPLLYCAGGGAIGEASRASLEFTDMNSLINGINTIVNNYDEYTSKIEYEKLGSQRCSREYLDIINELK